MAQTDMFEMLGLLPEKKKEEKKSSSTNKANGNKIKSSGGSMTKDNFTLSEEGLTVVTGYYPETTIELSAFEDKEAGDTVSASEVFKVAIANGLESFVEGKTKFAELKNGKVLMVSDGIAMTEPKKKFQGEYRILLGGYETTYDAEEFGMDEVKKTWFTAYPEHEGLVDFQYDTERKIIVPVYKQKVPKESKEGVLAIWGQEPKQFKDKKVTDAVKELYGDLEGNYHLVITEDTYYVVPYIKSGVATAKEVMYPTSGVTLSLVFSRIPLNPEMFGGKEKVTEKELLKVITDDYPEYGDGRATVNYLKKEKLIVVSIKSAKKGAGLCHARFNADKDNFCEVKKKAINFVAENTDEHVLCYIDLEQDKFLRVEKNAIGIFSGGVKDHSEFIRHIPKIPRAIMEEIYVFFLAVKNFMPRSNEAAAQIFWNKKSKKFFVYYPYQVVSTVSVAFDRNTKLEISNVLVMDVHSHGSIRPIFSSIDDRDEKGTRLFCVMGEMEDTTRYHFSLRAGTAGNFIPVKDEDIFEDFFDGMFTNEAVLNLSEDIDTRRLVFNKVTFDI